VEKWGPPFSGEDRETVCPSESSAIRSSLDEIEGARTARSPLSSFSDLPRGEHWRTRTSEGRFPFSGGKADEGRTEGLHGGDQGKPRLRSSLLMRGESCYRTIPRAHWEEKCAHPLPLWFDNAGAANSGRPKCVPHDDLRAGRRAREEETEAVKEASFFLSS